MWDMLRVATTSDPPARVGLVHPAVSGGRQMTFATNCLRASGIIRKQLVQLDSVMHPSSQHHHHQHQFQLQQQQQQQSAPGDERQRTPRSELHSAVAAIVLKVVSLEKRMCKLR